KLNLVAITPASTGGAPLPIAGNFLANFGGFFDEAYRAYDFAAGEHAASEVLTEAIPGTRPLLGPEAPRAARPVAPGVDPSYRGLPATSQLRFESMVEAHARALASVVGVPG